METPTTTEGTPAPQNSSNAIPTTPVDKIMARAAKAYEKMTSTVITPAAAVLASTKNGTESRCSQAIDIAAANAANAKNIAEANAANAKNIAEAHAATTKEAAELYFAGKALQLAQS